MPLPWKPPAGPYVFWFLVFLALIGALLAWAWKTFPPSPQVTAPELTRPQPPGS